MSSATFAADLHLFVGTVSRDWDENIVKELAQAKRPKEQHAKPAPKLVMLQATNEPRVGFSDLLSLSLAHPESSTSHAECDTAE